MNASTMKLHAALYRHLRGAIDAYRDWIKENHPTESVDVIKHFKEQSEHIAKRQQ